MISLIHTLSTAAFWQENKWLGGEELKGFWWEEHKGFWQEKHNNYQQTQPLAGKTQLF
jgi:hypothetical protein